MIKINNPKDCCGCTACVNICAHNAITMIPDDLGFLYPVVDMQKCVNCGLCEKTCQFHENYDYSNDFTIPIAYAARHNDIKEVMKSRSGAAFVAISDFIIEKGGVIYGVGYKDHFRVVHKRAITKEDRDEFRGSKYVQSDLTGVFKQIKQDLISGREVLFSGTPCQTAGLNSYIGKALRKKLVLVDVICHGVPGPYLWRDYLQYLEKKHGNKLIKVNFRDKTKYGWSTHVESYKYESGKEVSYTNIFYNSIMFRQSCNVCYYTNIKRPSDITLGDFWGWESVVPDFVNDTYGVSLVLCNSEKGYHIINSIKHNLKTVPVKIDKCLQPSLVYPTMAHSNRNQFEYDYKRKGIKFVLDRYCSISISERIRRFRAHIKKIITR